MILKSFHPSFAGKMMTSKSGLRRVIVSGDVVVDHHLYQGARTTPAARARNLACVIFRRLAVPRACAR
jgi:hypothetical protein